MRRPTLSPQPLLNLRIRGLGYTRWFYSLVLVRVLCTRNTIPMIMDGPMFMLAGCLPELGVQPFFASTTIR